MNYKIISSAEHPIVQKIDGLNLVLKRPDIFPLLQEIHKLMLSHTETAGAVSEIMYSIDHLDIEELRKKYIKLIYSPDETISRNPDHIIGTFDQIVLETLTFLESYIGTWDTFQQSRDHQQQKNREVAFRAFKRSFTELYIFLTYWN